MEVILMERVPKLGQIGEVVRVKDGYARNFLLPAGKALRATEGNKARFEDQRAQLEARDVEKRSEAETLKEKVDEKVFVIIRQAGETGQLYGSVSTRDIAETVTTGGISVHRNQVELTTPIKTLGMHKVAINLYGDVSASVTMNIARSEDEAERQERGEEIITREDTNMDDLGLEVGAALAEAGDADDRGRE